jgi:membrane protein
MQHDIGGDPRVISAQGSTIVSAFNGSAGLAAAAVWVTASFAFTRLVGVSTHMLAIYASFAILLAALMWVWLNWLILLTGALLAFYLQNPEYLRAGQREVMPTPRLREGLALSSMYLVARAFSEGRERPTLESLAETLTVPAIALAPVLHALETSGLLEHTEEEGLLPGRDPTRITLDEVVAAVRGGHSGRAMTLHRAALVNPAQQACDRIEAAIRRELGAATLAEFAQTDDVPR